MKVADRVELNLRIMMGKPVIRGTRIPVELILRRLSEGANERELLNAYPPPQKENIKAATTGGSRGHRNETPCRTRG